jgi:hypothetical protein
MAILDGLAVRGASSATAGADIVKTANAKTILILPLLPPRMAEQRPVAGVLRPYQFKACENCSMICRRSWSPDDLRILIRIRPNDSTPLSFGLASDRR